MPECRMTSHVTTTLMVFESHICTLSLSCSPYQTKSCGYRCSQFTSPYTDSHDSIFSQVLGSLGIWTEHVNIESCNSTTNFNHDYFIELRGAGNSFQCNLCSQMIRYKSTSHHYTCSTGQIWKRQSARLLCCGVSHDINLKSSGCSIAQSLLLDLSSSSINLAYDES